MDTWIIQLHNSSNETAFVCKIKDNVTNISQIYSKMDKLEYKVNKIIKGKNNLKVKIDAINVEKNTCLSKWDKLDVDLDFEGLQKTTYVIHQKKLTREKCVQKE